MTTPPLDRRRFLLSAAAALPAASCAAAARPVVARPAGRAAGPVAISSGNGLRAVNRAHELIVGGVDPTTAVVQGVKIVEDDPDDLSVGYGGLPNEDGVVELDASVMDGPMHKAGAVAGLRNIRNPASVALKVCRRTDHVLIVGEGALRFARRFGFEEENLLTDRARREWLRWRANLNPNDDWLDEDQRLRRRGEAGLDDDQAAAGAAGADPHVVRDAEGVLRTWGTIHCAAVDAGGDLGACTTTSGLSWKIPGRVGDSPIIGAGMYVDNEVGAAGATGRGESLMQSCGSFQIVRHMADGMAPTEACLAVLKWIADHTKRPELLNGRGEPNFNAVVYALRKDGAFGSACIRGKRTFAVHDGAGGRLEEATPLYE